MYTPQLFGATGDGVTDDYAAIHAAIGYLSGKGGTLHLPPGTYLMSSALRPVSNVSIKGSGRGVTFIKNIGNAPSPTNLGLIIYGELTGDYTTAATYAIIAPVEGQASVTTITPADAGCFPVGSIIAISGELHGTNFWYPFWTTEVISVDATTGVITLAERLPFGGASMTLVQRVLNRPHDIRVSDLTIIGEVNAAVGVSLTKDVMLDNIEVVYGAGGAAASSFFLTASRECTVQNSKFPGVVDLLGDLNCSCLNNRVMGGSIVLDGGAQGCLVSGNDINESATNGAPASSIFVVSKARRNLIIGNRIRNIPSGRVGIAITGDGENEGGNVVMGNVLSGVDGAATDGIAISGSDKNVIVGNVLSNLHIGIDVEHNSVGQELAANSMAGVAVPIQFGAGCS